MVNWEYKLHYQPLATKFPLTKKGGLENYGENLEKSEKEINKLAREDWELFTTNVTAFNMLVFVFRRKLKDKKK